MLLVWNSNPRLNCWCYADAYLYFTSGWEHSVSLSIARKSNREIKLISYSVEDFP